MHCRISSRSKGIIWGWGRGGGGSSRKWVWLACTTVSHFPSHILDEALHKLKVNYTLGLFYDSTTLIAGDCPLAPRLFWLWAQGKRYVGHSKTEIHIVHEHYHDLKMQSHRPSQQVHVASYSGIASVAINSHTIIDSD